MNRLPVFNPVEVWARDPKRVRLALDLLAESKGTTADEIQAHGIAHSWDPETVHLAVSIAWEGGCRRCREGDLCDLGRQLDREIDASVGAYLEAVAGPDFKFERPVESHAMVDALGRFRAHRGDHHGR